MQNSSPNYFCGADRKRMNSNEAVRWSWQFNYLFLKNAYIKELKLDGSDPYLLLLWIVPEECLSECVLLAFFFFLGSWFFWDFLLLRVKYVMGAVATHVNDNEEILLTLNPTIATQVDIKHQECLAAQCVLSQLMPAGCSAVQCCLVHWGTLQHSKWIKQLSLQWRSHQ